DQLLVRAKAHGVYGTKERSVINSTDPDGIAAAVRQQFEVGNRVLSHELMPIIEPEHTIKAPLPPGAAVILRHDILAHLEAVPAGRQVRLKLSIPVEANFLRPLVEHPKVLNVVALSGGSSRDEACAQLARNDSMIASFSRALLGGLRVQMSDAEFDAALVESI